MDLRNYLRNKIYVYFNPLVKKDKCESCGSIENLEVHHEYQFSKMLNDVLNELDLDLKNVEDYTEKELLNVTEKMLGKHLRYSYKTLCKECHMLITKKQSEERRQNITKEDFNKLTIELDDKWLDVDLTKKDKDEMVEYFHLKDYEWRIIKWTRLKKIIENSGYVIKDKKIRKNGKQTRVSIISKK